MEQITFFEHYRLSVDEEGSSGEVSRTGAAITYKAIDLRSHEPVVLQLIPIASVDPATREQFEERARTAQELDHINMAKVFAVGVEHEYLALVSEYLPGETADSWVVAHGPMPADAVLRVGMQVVRALAAAAFHGLTHRAIQPSNLLIVPGQTADGGWPFVKLLNFGLAGLELHSDSSGARELAPSAPPQFASPEQLVNRPLDFRSEIYSLGATMCFLLTGAVPLPVEGMKARLRVRRLPELRRAPRALRSLLAHMLRENPDNRPQDPVAFEGEIRDCLTKIERRQAIGWRLGIPLAVVIPRSTSPRSTTTLSPVAQVWRGVVVFAVIALAVAVVGAFLLPDDLKPFWHNTRATDKIGVPVGVPETQPATGSSPAMVTANQNSQPNIQQPQAAPASSPTSASNSSTDSSARIVSVKRESEAPPPSESPNERSSPPEKPRDRHDDSVADTARDGTSKPTSNENQSGDSSSADSSSSRSETKSDGSTSHRTSRARRAQSTQVPSDESGAGSFTLTDGSVRARVVGTTPDGRLILRLPSGQTLFVRPRSDDEEVGAPRRHRRIWVERPEMVLPRAQPVEPGYPDND